VREVAKRELSFCEYLRLVGMGTAVWGFSGSILAQVFVHQPPRVRTPSSELFVNFGSQSREKGVGNKKCTVRSIASLPFSCDRLSGAMDSASDFGSGGWGFESPLGLTFWHIFIFGQVCHCFFIFFFGKKTCARRELNPGPSLGKRRS
jgi:hypothetical protein